MTQVKSAQHAGKEVASTPHARVRTLAQRRADVEHQIRAYVENDATMALTEPEQVKQRMKALRKRAGGPSQYEVAYAIKVPPRTFQSWENAEVETDRANYERVAAYYSDRLEQEITANWILFGQDHEPPLPSTTPDLAAALNGDSPSDTPEWARRLLDQQAELLRNQAELREGMTNTLEYLAYLTGRARREEESDSTEEVA